MPLRYLPFLGKSRHALPGFGLSLGFATTYLSLIVLLPICALLLKVAGMPVADLWRYAFDPRAVAAYKLTFFASTVAACINTFFGTILAWVLVRYSFFGRRLVDALVDVPFALPTAVAGLTLASLFSENGWLGSFLVPWGIKGAYSTLGIILALTFVSLPFVVRTLQPVLQNLDREVEEAAATLGAGRIRAFFSVIAPPLLPTVITGFALAFARSIGEFGSVIFISSNLPYEGEIAPLVIYTALEQFEYGRAMAMAFVLLIVSFLLLFAINLLERWAGRYRDK